jgi:hypothetical protein
VLERQVCLGMIAPSPFLQVTPAMDTKLGKFTRTLCRSRHVPKRYESRVHIMNPSNITLYVLCC